MLRKTAHAPHAKRRGLNIVEFILLETQKPESHEEEKVDIIGAILLFSARRSSLQNLNRSPEGGDMTMQNDGLGGDLGLLGAARIPGALGASQLAGHTTDRRGTKRLPGPLKIGPSILLMDSSVTKVAPKTFKMTPPWQDGSTKRVHVVDWDLGADSAQPTDVVQGSLSNCPVASILAALANTPAGAERIRNAVTSQPGNVVTDVAAVMQYLENDGEWKDKPNGSLSSKRYFTVELPGIKQEVSDVFYTDEGDRNWGLIYIGMPNPYNAKTRHVLWPSVIEKAYATELKGYDKLNDVNDPEVVWKALIGTKPTLKNVKGLKDSDITMLARAAKRVPTIATTRNDMQDADEKTRVEQQSAGLLEGWHGYAVTDLLPGNRIALYDPHGKAVPVKMADFRKFFTAVLYGNL
jgi:hypothetical protein